MSWSVSCRCLTNAWAAAMVAGLVWPHSTAAQDGVLQTIREDVRQTAVPTAPSHLTDGETGRGDRGHRYDESEAECEELTANPISDWLVPAAMVAGGALTSPIWVPHVMLKDSLQVPAYFPRFPYDQSPGYLEIQTRSPPLRSWAGRVDLQYLDNFDDVQSVGGNLLFSTTSRIGLDVSMMRIEERLAAGSRDRLSLGDCNLVFRFAQSRHAEFRTGLGFNWLDDPIRTDFGLNFTYAADFVPCKPWVISSTIDWGTLGRAELFRVRATAGAIIHAVEAYTGCEYLDIDRSQTVSLIGGVRLWF